ncbi:YggT family protein [Thermanaerosceptrum fracticalcis]|uniref:YggT family protein n=1 Tax=Thermanaerosceptrum fracticalcis TaxID=1712410 RepID=A0A7G6DZA3_THEFR|nr:YggT family protein [Thermanaerosceptrum fracticalcis]QNB45157.1 YggT family protein [Thermanaerosceptrum fracticalcis]
MTWLIPYVRIAFEVLDWLIIIRVLLSWVRHDPYNPIFRFIYEITEPVLAPFRRLMGGRMVVDFSPIVAIFVIQLVEMLVIDLLRTL